MSLQYGILGLLNYAPMTGYNLKKLFDESVNNIWEASLSQIYRELGTLEKNGLVTSQIEQQDDRPDKKIYSISEEGKIAFGEWLVNFSDKFISPKRDEFMLRIFFGAQLGKAKMKKQFQRFIDDRKKAFELIDGKKDLLDIGKAIKKDQLSAEEILCIKFVIKRAQMTNRMLVEWAEECIKELEK
jgi:DNA-binding PadR family transcriptional regulator